MGNVKSCCRRYCCCCCCNGNHKKRSENIGLHPMARALEEGVGVDKVGE